MKVLVGAFNQEKALVGAFSMIVQLHRFIIYTAPSTTPTWTWSVFLMEGRLMSDRRRSVTSGLLLRPRAQEAVASVVTRSSSFMSGPGRG